MSPLLLESRLFSHTLNQDTQRIDNHVKLFHADHTLSPSLEKNFSYYVHSFLFTMLTLVYDILVLLLEDVASSAMGKKLGIN